MRLTQGSRHKVCIVGINTPAGKGHLAGMFAHRFRSLR